MSANLVRRSLVVTLALSAFACQAPLLDAPSALEPGGKSETPSGLQAIKSEDGRRCRGPGTFDTSPAGRVFTHYNLPLVVDDDGKPANHRRPDGFSYSDVVQRVAHGSDCQLLAALAAVAFHSDRLSFLFHRATEEGDACVDLYDQGWKPIYVSADLPRHPAETLPYFTDPKGELWVALLEKALLLQIAGLDGKADGYAYFDRGHNELVPSVTTYEALGYTVTSFDKERDPPSNPDFVALLRAALSEPGTVASIASWSNDTDYPILERYLVQQETSPPSYNVLVKHHMYAVLGIAEGQLRIYNPFGAPVWRVPLADVNKVFRSLAIARPRSRKPPMQRGLD